MKFPFDGLIKISDLKLKTINQEQYDSWGSVLLNGVFLVTSTNPLAVQCLNPQRKTFLIGSSSIIFLRNKYLHNINSPAVISQDENRQYSKAFHFNNGKLDHRNGPAIITYDKQMLCNQIMQFFPQENSKIIHCSYFDEDSRVHKLDGPAIIDTRSYNKFFIHGTEISTEQYPNHPDVILHKNKMALQEKLRKL